MIAKEETVARSSRTSLGGSRNGRKNLVIEKNMHSNRKIYYAVPCLKFMRLTVWASCLKQCNRYSRWGGGGVKCKVDPSMQIDGYNSPQSRHLSHFSY
jgi:hypothetical protein